VATDGVNGYLQASVVMSMGKKPPLLNE